MTVVKRFQSWSLPWRIVVGAAVTFVAGPGLIGFLSEYATYWYALGEGVRPPVEGIPYLAATVTVASMLIAAFVSAVFLLSRMVIAYTVGSMVLSVELYAKAPFEFYSKHKSNLENAEDAESIELLFSRLSETPKKFRKMKAKKALGTILFSGFAVFSIALVIATLRSYPNPTNLALVFGGYTSVIMLSLWRKFFMLLISVLAASMFYFFTISLLFNTHYYSNFLQGIGFGGGTLVQVDIMGESQPIDMILVLRSKEWLIGKTTDSQRNIEIRVQNIEHISFTNTKRDEL